MGLVMGIDPGLDGAVATLGDRDILFLFPTPTVGRSGEKRSFDLDQMRRLLVANQPELVVIEKVGAMPGQGVTSMFNFGMGYGMWLGLLAALQIPHQAVMPTVWKRVILASTRKDKAAGIEFISRRFPDVSLLATPRSRVPHDGMADAACLALYARQLLNGR